MKKLHCVLFILIFNFLFFGHALADRPGCPAADPLQEYCYLSYPQLGGLSSSGDPNTEFSFGVLLVRNITIGSPVGTKMGQLLFPPLSEAHWVMAVDPTGRYPNCGPLNAIAVPGTQKGDACVIQVKGFFKMNPGPQQVTVLVSSYSINGTLTENYTK